MLAGEEDAGPRAENEGGGAEGEGEVRGCPAGDQPVQSQVHGGHDTGVREVPGDGGPAVAVLQGCAVRRTQMSQHLTGSSVRMIESRRCCFVNVFKFIVQRISFVFKI